MAKEIRFTFHVVEIVTEEDVVKPIQIPKKINNRYKRNNPKYREILAQEGNEEEDLLFEEEEEDSGSFLPSDEKQLVERKSKYELESSKHQSG